MMSNDDLLPGVSCETDILLFVIIICCRDFNFVTNKDGKAIESNSNLISQIVENV